METPDTILEFWFGRHQDLDATAAAQAGLWWGKDPAADRKIRERFEPTLELTAAGRLDAWAASAGGCLALILLTDQFPRSMYRGSPAAFGFDAAARRWCNHGLGAQLDRTLNLLHRVFFYLPLEHSEVLADQERSIMLFETLACDAPEKHRALFTDYSSYARRHHDIVARFGRFPHRNAVLGRVSTPEEEEFLSRPGSSF